MLNYFLDNRTPFNADTFVIPNNEGQEIMVLVVSCTFEEKIGQKLQLADEQCPIRLADGYFGESGFSSIRYESDVALEKPKVDILVIGHAYAPDGRPANEVPIQLKVGDVNKQLLVSGDRHWRIGAFGTTTSKPEPFVKMPVIYERAFGGTNRQSSNPSDYQCDVRNPVGVGYRKAVSVDPKVHTEVPNIEYINQRISAPSDQAMPASLGVVGRGWQPRISFAGTYDEKWLKEQWPLLPLDFDSRHYQAAPHDQQSSTIRGGEMVGLLNMTPNGLWVFRLPFLNIPLRYYFDDRVVEAVLRLDTVLIEPDQYRVTLTSRASVKTIRNKAMLREIVLGHMSPGWVRAHAKKKDYFDSSGKGGNLDMPSFQL